MATAKVTVRPVLPSDGPAWVDLRSRLWPEAPGADLASEVARFFAGEGPWRLATDPFPFAAFVAEDGDGRIVGFVEASIRPYAEGCRSSPVGYLEGWFVLPDHRRRGIGRLLVRRAEAWAASSGCSEIGSDARADNPLSEAGHRALGYEVVERAVHFRRALDPPDPAAARPGAA